MGGDFTSAMRVHSTSMVYEILVSPLKTNSLKLGLVFKTFNLLVDHSRSKIILDSCHAWRWPIRDGHGLPLSSSSSSTSYPSQGVGETEAGTP